MIARAAALILAAAGACISYPAKKIAQKTKGEEATEGDVLKIKLTGLVFVTAAAVIAIADKVMN